MAKTRIKTDIFYRTSECGQGCGSSRTRRRLRRRGEVVAAITRALAGRGRNLDHISVAIDQEAGSAEMRCQPERTAEPPGEHAFGFRRLFGIE